MACQSPNMHFDVLGEIFLFLGGEDGYNIPEVTQLDKLKEYLYGEPMQVADLDNKKSDDKILRFYEDPSLCFYRNKRFMMYKWKQFSVLTHKLTKAVYDYSQRTW